MKKKEKEKKGINQAIVNSVWPLTIHGSESNLNMVYLAPNV